MTDWRSWARWPVSINTRVSPETAVRIMALARARRTSQADVVRVAIDRALPEIERAAGIQRKEVAGDQT